MIQKIDSDSHMEEGRIGGALSLDHYMEPPTPDTLDEDLFHPHHDPCSRADVARVLAGVHEGTSSCGSRAHDRGCAAWRGPRFAELTWHQPQLVLRSARRSAERGESIGGLFW